MKRSIVAPLLCSLSVAASACPAAAGSLEFFANGEGLAVEGFQAPELTRDGWALSFDHVFVNIADITGYQADPAFEAHKGGEIEAAIRVEVPGTYTVDLASPEGDDTRLLVATARAEPGHYNAISWRIAKATEGPAAGFSMVLVGTAEKDGRSVPFRIETTEETIYRCGEYVGDERKGLVASGEVADLEMTFHLDHVFGREDKGTDDPMNVAARGFEPFAGGAGPHTLDLGGLHIGHAGEGHCSIERL